MGPAEFAHGPMFIGVVLNVALYGIMITQIYLYYTTYKRDRAWMKILVLAVFVADTINTVFDIWYLYESVITHFDDPAFLEKANLRFDLDPVMTGIIELTVQLFFSWRVWVLTKNLVIVVLIVLLSLGAGGCAFATSYEVTVIPAFAQFRGFKKDVIGWLVCASAADIIITSVLVWYLCRRHKTGFKASDMMIDRIIRVTMQTGLLTSMFAILDLLVYLADPTGMHLIFNFVLCKLYSNSLLSSLNSRGGWRYDESTDGKGTRALTDKRGGRLTTFNELRTCWSDKTLASPGTPTKARTFEKLRRGSMTKPEVFIHVESHETHDLEALAGQQLSSKE